RFVDTNTPKNNGRVIPIPSNHLTNIANCEILPRSIANMLPPRNFLQNQQTDFIAIVKKMHGLWVMRRAHNVTLQLFFENECISSLYARWHGSSHVRKRLMPIKPAQFQRRSVQTKSIWSKAGVAEANARGVFVHQLISLV